MCCKDIFGAYTEKPFVNNYFKTSGVNACSHLWTSVVKCWLILELIGNRHQRWLQSVREEERRRSVGG